LPSLSTAAGDPNALIALDQLDEMWIPVELVAPGMNAITVHSRD
jgi:hypothetical protein